MKIRIAVWLLTLLARTWRVRVTGNVPSEPAVITFWHGDMLPVWWWFRGKNATALVSHSKDGSYLAALLDTWGYTLARGSSSTGGREALQAMVNAAQVGHAFVTPDGPRGPRHQAKPGAIVAAQRAGVPVIPIVVKVSSGHVFKRSWDKFTVPWPGSRIVISIGRQLWPNADATREEITEMVEVLTKELNGTQTE